MVLGLLSDLPCKSCWTIAEWAGHRTPDGMQHLLGRAKWDADQVRDDVRDYAGSFPSATERTNAAASLSRQMFRLV